MHISLGSLGKKFNNSWLFRNFDLELEKNGSYAILGINGSGKSTLLQLIAGNISPTEGSVSYSLNNAEITAENIYNHLSLAAPYMDLPEELTLEEMIAFHFGFKPMHADVPGKKILEVSGLATSAQKQLKLFSSGMKQRVKLSLAICSDTPLLLLDEPCTNLDAQGIDWYRGLIAQYCRNRIVVVASNQEHEYSFCEKRVNLNDYKVLQKAVTNG